MAKLVHGTSSEHLLYPMIRYGQKSGTDALCKAILLTHLGEPQDLERVANATEGVSTRREEVGAHAKNLVRLLKDRNNEGKEMTMAMLVKEWRSTSDAAPE